MPDYRRCVQQALADFPRRGEATVARRGPAVADVMGGICENGGSLVVTAALDLFVRTCGWPIESRSLQLRMHDVSQAQSGPSDFEIPHSAFKGPVLDLIGRCRQAGADWAVSICLALYAAVAAGEISLGESGVAVVLFSEIPQAVDFGRPCVCAAIVLDALRALRGGPRDAARLATLAAAGGTEVVGISRMRIPLTSLCAEEGGALFQIRTRPKVEFKPFALPAGLTIRALRTVLDRPTTRDRLIEAARCGELGARIIGDLRREDGLNVDDSFCLAAISPEDWVERYRDRMPSRSNRAFSVATFSTVRGLPDGNGAVNLVKVRSRTEHHIYENDRAWKFVNAMSRADRVRTGEQMTGVSHLVCSSHWSHSQRCGIGGVEVDRISKGVRALGPAAGLFGAKVTGGGAGGEMVALMQDVEPAHRALRAAVEAAEQKSQKPVQVYALYSGGQDEALASLADLLA